MTHKHLASLAIAVSLCASLSASLTGCGRVQQTLPPMAADVIGTRTQFVTDRFGVCFPEFNTSVVADPLSPPGAGEVRAGYTNHIRPGQTCNTQESFGYNGLVHFDQAALQGKIIISAGLHFDRRNTNLPVRVFHNAPAGPVNDVGCSLLVRAATETWSGGASSGPIASEPLPGSTEFSSSLVQQNAVVGGSVDVTNIVRQWALGRKPNKGFVIMAKPGALGKDENSCTGFWSNARLEMTVLDFPAH